MKAIELFAGPGGPADQCWAGLGTDHGNGYRTARVDGKPQFVHRLSYEYHVGPIPDGMVIDHTCHNLDDGCPGGDECQHRQCWNPAHLEPVSNRENILRGRSPSAENARLVACSICGGEFRPEGEGRRCGTCKQRRRTDTKRKGIGRPAERTRCPAGHLYDAENTYFALRSDGTVRNRQCKRCSRDKARERRAKGKM